MRYILFFMFLFFIQRLEAKTFCLFSKHEHVSVITKTYENNGLIYDFSFTNNLNTNNIPREINDSFLLIKVRMSIVKWTQSPFRFGLSSLEEFEERIKFFSFSFGNSVNLYQDDKPCLQMAYVLDANLNAAPFENFTLVYKLNKKFHKTKKGFKVNISEPFLLKGNADIIIENQRNNFFKKIIALL